MNLHNLSSTILLLFLFHLLRTTTASPPRSPPPPPPSPSAPPCSDELETFSVCLPYISSSKNNLPDTPPIECCDAFASSFSYNHSSCLCYLSRQSLILGFPVNSSRFFSLPSLCIRVDSRFRVNKSDASLCPGSPSLPPLYSITGLGRGQSKSHPEQQSHAHIADSQPNSEMTTSTRSSATVFMTNKFRWVPLSVVFFSCIVML